MAETKYTYSILNDTLNGKVNSDTLSDQIQASSIIVALARIDTNGDVLDIVMKAALDSGEQTVLTGVVAAHDGAASEEPCLVYTKQTELASLDGHDLYRHSFIYEPVAETDNYWHEKMSEPLGLQGGEYKIVGTPTWGDYLEMMVTDEDNVLGYGAGVVLKKFIEKEYLFTGGYLENFFAPDASELSNLFYLTVRYVSVGTEVPKVVIRYNFRRVSS